MSYLFIYLFDLLGLRSKIVDRFWVVVWKKKETVGTMLCEMNNLEIDWSLFSALMSSFVVSWAQSTDQITICLKYLDHFFFILVTCTSASTCFIILVCLNQVFNKYVINKLCSLATNARLQLRDRTRVHTHDCMTADARQGRSSTGFQARLRPPWEGNTFCVTLDYRQWPCCCHRVCEVSHWFHNLQFRSAPCWWWRQLL